MKALVAILLFAVNAVATTEPRLPRSWVMADENLPVAVQPEAPSSEVSDSIDLALRTHSSVLDDFAASEPRRPDEGKWKLRWLALDLAVSLQGGIGVLFAKGTPAVTLYWKRQAAPSRFPETPEEIPTLAFGAPVSLEVLRQRVEPLVQGMLATGRVRDGAALRKNLLQAAVDFETMVASMLVPPASKWVPGRLRLDFVVDAAGMVYPGVTVGGGIKLRFDWVPGVTGPYAPANFGERKLGEAFRRFLQALARELQRVRVDDVMAPASLPLGAILFSLAVSATGQFGLVSGDASVIGTVYFYRRGGREPRSLPELTGRSSVPIFSGARGTFFPTHEALQRGIEKAALMGAYFAERAAGNHGRSWVIDAVCPSFTLSVGATATVASLSASAGLALAYYRPHVDN
jgi:hypothetical protein